MRYLKYIIFSLLALSLPLRSETQLFSMDGEALNDVVVGMVVGSVCGGGGGMWAVTMVGGGMLGYFIGAPDRQNEKEIRNDPKNNRVVDTKNPYRNLKKN